MMNDLKSSLIMKQLLIIGAKGYGREIYHLAKESKGYGTEFDIKGYLDDKADALDGYNGYPKILGPVENYDINDDDVFICALGDVIYKKKYVDIILAKGGKFINLIHKNACIRPNSTIGKGCIVCQNAIISCDVRIGDFVTLQPFVVIGHDAIIGDFCHLNTYSFMGGFAKLEDMVTLHTSAVMLPHAKAENGSIVGASSVVIKKVKAGTTVYGNPAVRLIY